VVFFCGLARRRSIGPRACSAIFMRGPGPHLVPFPLRIGAGPQVLKEVFELFQQILRYQTPAAGYAHVLSQAIDADYC